MRYVRLLLLALIAVAVAMLGESAADTRPAGAETDLTGAWDWVSTANSGATSSGVAAIRQHGSGFRWGWVDSDGTGWAAPVTLCCFLDQGDGTISGDAVQVPSWSNDRALSTIWTGTLSPDGKSIAGAWTRSDGLAGTFVAAKLPTFAHVVSDGSWKFSRQNAPGWQETEFDDSSWGATVANSGGLCGLTAPGGMWPPNPVEYETVYFRKTFDLPARPLGTTLTAWFDDDGVVYMNGGVVHINDDHFASGTRAVDIAGSLQAGRNSIAIWATDAYYGGCQSVILQAAIVVDIDQDGVLDPEDNCPSVPNAGQENNVHPGTFSGDYCEDPEPDGVYDVVDNCPDTANPLQDNFDADALGDACDGDDDGDGYWDDDESLKASVVLNAASTPEHCDGVDNDGDTAVDETPAGTSWDIDGDTVKDCSDATVDTDGDGLVNTLDADDDMDGRTDVQERKLSTDELGACPSGASHDGWASDRDRDGDADVGDVIQAFGMGKIGSPANYDARSDPDMDGDNDIGDVIQLYGMGKMGTKCSTLTYTNGTGGPVDDIHLEWSAPIAEVFVARDSELAGWSSRVISGGGTVLDMERPDGSGDLAAGGTLTVVVRTASMMGAVTLCRWTQEGVDVGAC